MTNKQNKNIKANPAEKNPSEKSSHNTTQTKLSDLARAFEHTTGMVTIADPNGIVKYTNPRFREVTGYTDKETIGQLMAPLNTLPPKQRKQKFIDLQAGVLWQSTYRNTKKNDARFGETFSISAVNGADGKTDFFIKIASVINPQATVESAFHKSDKAYGEILDAIEEGYYEVDLAGNFTLCNQAICRSIGIPREKLLGMNTRQYRSAETARELYELFNGVYKTGRTAVKKHHKLLNKDGVATIVDMTVSLLRDKSGRPVGFSGITRDRTKQTEAEKALRQSEESYRNVLALAPDVITISRIDDGTYLEVNDAFSQTSGFSTEEVIGKTSMDLNIFFDPTDRDRIVEGIRQNGRVDAMEVKFYTKTKFINFALLSCRPINFRGEECLLTISTIITSLREAETARFENEKKYRQIIESFQEGYYEVDLAGNFIFFNEALRKDYGYDAEKLMGMNNREFTSPEIVKKAGAVFSQVYRTGLPDEIDNYEVIRQDGAIATITLSVSLLRDEKGTPIGFYGISRDVTEKRRFEQALRESERKYRTTLDAMQDGYYEIDLSGNMVFFNEALAKIHGYPANELMGMNYRKYSKPDEAKRVADIYIEVYRTGTPSQIIDYEVINKDGTSTIIETSAALLRDASGEPVGFYGISRNVTEKRKTEQALRESERKYRTTLEAMQEGYYETNLAGDFTFFNGALARIHGYPADELMGMDRKRYSIPEEAKRLTKIYREVYRTGVPIEGIDYEILKKDGTKVTLELSSSLLRDSNGKPIGFYGISRDVTEKRKTEQSLRESERKYRATLETMQEGYYEIDLDGNFTFFNEALARIHGYPAEELLGMNNRQYSNPEEAKRVFNLFREVHRTDKPSRIIDYEVIKKDGTAIIVETSASLLRNDAGEPIGFYGISRDVTQRKEIDIALRQSEKKYRTILENIEEGYFEVDLTGNLTFCNEALCQIYGYPYEEFIGMNNRDYTTPETAEKIFAIFTTVYQTGVTSPIIDYEVLRKDGSVVMIETAASLLRDANGEPIGFNGIVRDRTEQKKSELALRESEESYRLLVENANEGIYITQDDVVKFPNKKTEVLTGYNAEELSTMSFASLIHPKGKKGIVERMSKPVGPNHPENTFSIRIINRANETLWVELNTVQITWEGRPATLNFLKDVSPQKKMEAQFRQAQKMEAIGTLAGGIAHDFNNLLMGVQGNASLVLLELDPDHPHVEKLINIERLVKGGAELTKQLLGAAKGGKYEVKPTDLNDLVEKGATLFGRTRKEVRIHKKFQENIWPVEVDRSQIDQVLLNLYVNAWQAMADGGDLYLETKNVILDEYYVRPYSVEAGNFVRISVTDTGSGMDESTRKRVFDPFFTTKKMNRGTGLGLASAYGIIGNHKGIINVYSEIGEGSTFSIYLPISDKEIIKESVALKKIYTGKETILFVDDEEAISQLGRLLLQKLGYNVFSAESGDEAIKIYEKEHEKISLVILDMIMPGMNGGETFDKLKEINPLVKVLLSSGYSINGQAKKILDRGCRGFLQKPFNVAEFSEKLRKILDE
jgi:two-component system, cell cycle sensor histidine kinase and response regulator CckA